QGQGGVTAEYARPPRSTTTRTPGENRGPGGRSQEIQRLVVRALRAVVERAKMGERTVWVDCDVIQADGGTRTAAITGGFIAVADALGKAGVGAAVRDCVAAISVGIVAGGAVLNAGKVRELAGLLGDLPITLVSLREVPGASLPPETGATYVENALIKARAAHRLTGHAALADDSGLEVDALGGAPGLHSARF